MDREHELPRFVEWQAALSEKKPRRKEELFGKVLKMGEELPKGLMAVRKHFGRGTLYVWSDALVFIAKPPGGVGRSFGKDLLKELASDLTFGVTDLAGAAGKRLFGKLSPEELMERASNEYSMFIPLSQLDEIEGGTGLLGHMGSKIVFHFTNFAGEKATAHFFATGQSFNPRRLRRKVEKAVEAHNAPG